MNKEYSEEIRHYLALVFRWLWLLIAATTIAGAIAFVISLRMTPIYEASALVLIEAPNIGNTDYNSVLASERLTKTYAERMTTRPILSGVIQRLGLKLSEGELKEMIKVYPVRDTQLIEVKVESSNPNEAALIANTLFMEFSEKDLAQQASRFTASRQNLEDQLAQLDKQIESTSETLIGIEKGIENQSERNRLEATLTEYRQTYTSLMQSYEEVRLAEAQFTSMVALEEPAVASLAPIRPHILANTFLAAILGLLLSIGAVFLIEALDDTLHTPDDVTRHLNLPVLAMIANYQNKDNKPITATHPRAPVAEAFRSLRTNLDFACVERPLRNLLVISPTPEDGKSTVATNLAVVVSQSERRVLLIDADMRRPMLHNQLGLSNRTGLSKLFLESPLSGEESGDLGECIQATEFPNLSALTSGALPPNPADLLGSTKMLKLLNQLDNMFDLVVIDSPPLLAVTDGVVLAPHVDGVLLVLRPGETKLRACRQTAEQLRRVGANLLGVVLNDIPIKNTSYSYYSYLNYHYPYDQNFEISIKKHHPNGRKPTVNEKLDKSEANPRV